MEKELVPLNQSSSKLEKYVKLGTALISSAGPIGATIATVINDSICAAQNSRMVDFVNELYFLFQEQNKEIENIKTKFEMLFSNSASTLLFELCEKASVQTNSNTLHHCYAYFIFNSIENKTLEDSRNEKLLQTLSELKEEEIIYLINFTQHKALGCSSEFDDKYKEIIMPKSRTDHIPENEIHNAFRDEYILTLEQKGLITIIMKNNGTKLPISNNDVHITDYGKLLVEAIYDENFFGKLNGASKHETE